MYSFVLRSDWGRWGNEEKADTQTHKNIVSGWTGLSDGETAAPWELSLYIVYIWTERQDKEMGLLYTNKWGGRVYLIQLYTAGSRKQVLLIVFGADSVVEQSLCHDYQRVETYGGHFLHTLSTLTLIPERKALPFVKCLSLWGPWHGHTYVNSKCSLGTSLTKFSSTPSIHIHNVHMWREENNYQEFALSFQPMGPSIQSRSPGLAASAATSWAPSLAQELLFLIHYHMQFQS